MAIFNLTDPHIESTTVLSDRFNSNHLYLLLYTVTTMTSVFKVMESSSPISVDVVSSFQAPLIAISFCSGKVHKKFIRNLI